MRVFLTSVLIIGIIGMAGFSFAKAKEVPQNAVSGESLTKAGEMENQVYEGKVVNTENGIALMAGDSAYLLQGKNLETLVGKTVKIRGKVIKGDLIITLFVAKAEVI